MPSGDWLDIGCGTGALTSAICDLCDPSSVVGCDPSGHFIDQARHHLTDSLASFVIASIDDLPTREGGFDAVVSGLVLNFLGDADNAVRTMRQRVRPQGLIGAYVWDYADGIAFLRYFWDEAVAIDASARDLDEGRRFPICRPDALAALFTRVGLREVETRALEIQTRFADFDDYWMPFLGGTGPAPAFVGTLDAGRCEHLRNQLKQRLPNAEYGAIDLRARAWAVRGFAP